MYCITVSWDQNTPTGCSTLNVCVTKSQIDGGSATTDIIPSANLRQVQGLQRILCKKIDKTDMRIQLQRSAPFTERQYGPLNWPFFRRSTGRCPDGPVTADLTGPACCELVTDSLTCLLVCDRHRQRNPVSVFSICSSFCSMLAGSVKCRMMSRKP